MDTGSERLPDGTGLSSLRDEAASASSPKASIPDAGWRTDILPFDERPCRQFVAVAGFCCHSGMTWHRQIFGTATIEKNGRQGYVHADIERLEKEGDMAAGTGLVVAWMPARYPALSEEIARDMAPLLAQWIEARSVETERLDPQDESPVRKDAPA